MTKQKKQSKRPQTVQTQTTSLGDLPATHDNLFIYRKHGYGHEVCFRCGHPPQCHTTSGKQTEDGKELLRCVKFGRLCGCF